MLQLLHGKFERLSKKRVREADSFLDKNHWTVSWGPSWPPSGRHTLVAANLRASITTVGPLAENVSRELALVPTQVALLITMPVILFAVLSPLAPPLARRIGIEQALALALGILSVGIVLRSLPGWPALWLGTAGLGAAIAVINVFLPSLVKRDFPNDVWRVTGFYASV